MNWPLIGWRGRTAEHRHGEEDMQEQTQLQPTATDEIAVLDAPVVPVELPEDDAELEELLIREITIDGMCGVY
jgi:mycofactocin precursor